MNKVFSFLMWSLLVATGVLTIISTFELPWYYMACADFCAITTLMVDWTPIREWLRKRKKMKSKKNV